MLLSQYGSPVQKSVFWLRVSPKQLQKIRETLPSLLDLLSDTLLLVPLSHSCVEGVVQIGTSTPLKEPERCFIAL